MNYSAPSSSILIDQPFNNPLTKIAFGIGLVYVGYIGIKYATKDESNTNDNRRSRSRSSTNDIYPKIPWPTRTPITKEPTILRMMSRKFKKPPVTDDGFNWQKYNKDYWKQKKMRREVFGF
jgi:hypothetical protein